MGLRSIIAAGLFVRLLVRFRELGAQPCCFEVGSPCALLDCDTGLKVGPRQRLKQWSQAAAWITGGDTKELRTFVGDSGLIQRLKSCHSMRGPRIRLDDFHLSGRLASECNSSPRASHIFPMLAWRRAPRLAKAGPQLQCSLNKSTTANQPPKVNGIPCPVDSLRFPRHESTLVSWQVLARRPVSTVQAGFQMLLGMSGSQMWMSTMILPALLAGYSEASGSVLRLSPLLFPCLCSSRKERDRRHPVGPEASFIDGTLSRDSSKDGRAEQLPSRGRHMSLFFCSFLFLFLSF